MTCRSFHRLGSAVAACVIGLAVSNNTAGAADAGANFDLVCYGTGEKLDNQTDYEWDRKRHKYVEHSHLQNAQLEGSVQVEIHDGEGRIHLPKRLLPPIATGDDHGWWSLRNLSVDADHIRGSVKLNGFNKPSVDIDRQSGRIQIKGMEQFDGSCNAYNPGERRF